MLVSLPSFLRLRSLSLGWTADATLQGASKRMPPASAACLQPFIQLSFGSCGINRRCALPTASALARWRRCSARPLCQQPARLEALSRQNAHVFMHHGRAEHDVQRERPECVSCVRLINIIPRLSTLYICHQYVLFVRNTCITDCNYDPDPHSVPTVGFLTRCASLAARSSAPACCTGAPRWRAMTMREVRRSVAMATSHDA